MTRYHVAVMAILVSWLLPSNLQAEPPADKQASATPAKGRLPITISKATTYITEPLRLDGYPDYLAALNRMGSEGATPENNAVVVLVQAFGPEKIASEDREKFFKMLGIAAPPDTGDYYIEYEPYVRSHAPDALEDRQIGDQVLKATAWSEYDRAMWGPWSREDCPLMARWLAENEKPIQRMVEASKRPRFYIPAIGHGDPEMGRYLRSTFIGQLQCVREVARALKARAMLRLYERRTQQAWDDLQTCHRLSRLSARGPTVTECFIGIAVEGAACEGDYTFAHFARLTPERAAKCLADIRQLPPLPRAVDTANISERFVYLDMVCGTVRSTVKPDDMFSPLLPGMTVTIAGIDSDKLRDALRQWIDSGLVDWNEVLHLGNECFDRIVEAANKPQLAERQRAYAALDEEFKKQMASFRDVQSNAIAGALDVAKGRTPQQVTTQWVSAVYLADILGSGQALLAIDNHAAINLRLTEIALALGAYRTEHGRYPEELRVLLPMYLPQLPKDLYNDGDFGYRRSGDGYVLYSVGPNGKDDTGPPVDSSDPAYNEDLADSDDIGLRMLGRIGD